MSAYDEQMRDLINMTFETIDYSYEKYYIFLVNESNCGCIKGFMPQNRQVGFVVTSPHSNTNDLTRTIAHELGHGVFNLNHTYADYPSLSASSTDNLMDKGNGTKLHKYQWDLIQNPAFSGEICDNGIDDDKDGWIDCNDPDCVEETSGLKRKTLCSGQAVFREYPEQKFGFDDNKIESYPTFSTALDDGIPWKSLGIGVEDQVNVEFSDQLILSDLQYQATGIEILSGNTPQNYNETITIKGNSLTENAKIEVLDIDGNVIGGLMIKVLPAKSMILNLVLMKLPDDNVYPNVNFTIAELEEVLNNCFKQINMTWIVNTIDQYDFDFDLNFNQTLDGQEDFNILHDYLRLNETDPYTSRYYPESDPNLFNATSTYILYNKLQSSSSSGQSNGWTRENEMYGAVNCTYQHNKRTMAHENGHRIGYKHPWKEFSDYTEFDDADALMDYVNILSGYKIRAYQWTN